jgi:Nuclease-related domain
MGYKVDAVRKASTCAGCATMMSPGDDAARWNGRGCRLCDWCAPRLLIMDAVSTLDLPPAPAPRFVAGVGEPGSSVLRWANLDRVRDSLQDPASEPDASALRHAANCLDGLKSERLVGDDVEDELVRANMHGVVLHDRNHGAGNIDHIAITPVGIAVIDTKTASGELRHDPSAIGRQVSIGGYNFDDDVKAVREQADAVRTALAHWTNTVNVFPMLCLVNTDWHSAPPPVWAGDVSLVPRGRILSTIGRQEPHLSNDLVNHLACLLIEHFPAA